MGAETGQGGILAGEDGRKMEAYCAAWSFPGTPEHERGCLDQIWEAGLNII